MGIVSWNNSRGLPMSVDLLPAVMESGKVLNLTQLIRRLTLTRLLPVGEDILHRSFEQRSCRFRLAALD